MEFCPIDIKGADELDAVGCGLNIRDAVMEKIFVLDSSETSSSGGESSGRSTDQGADSPVQLRRRREKLVKPEKISVTGSGSRLMLCKCVTSVKLSSTPGSCPQTRN